MACLESTISVISVPWVIKCLHLCVALDRNYFRHHAYIHSFFFQKPYEFGYYPQLIYEAQRLIHVFMFTTLYCQAKFCTQECFFSPSVLSIIEFSLIYSYSLSLLSQNQCLEPYTQVTEAYKQSRCSGLTGAVRT